MAVVGTAALVAGIFTLLTGCLGLAAAHFKKCCFTMPFMIFAFIMSIFMLAVALIGFYAQNPENAEALICDAKDDVASMDFGDFDGLGTYM